MNDLAAQFRDAIRSAGLEPQGSIEPGKLHRFSTNGKPSDKAGYCKMFEDRTGGIYGDHRSGLSGTWQAKRDKPFTVEEREAFRTQCDLERFEREVKQLRRHDEAAMTAATILEAATGDPSSHPYAIKKSVSLGTLVKRGACPQRGWNDALLVPIYGADGKVWTIEAINTDGEKDYLAGGKKRGGFHPFGKIRGASKIKILIGEGIATVAAAVDATGLPAVAAMDAGNLAAAARAIKELAPNAELIFLVDNDIKADGSNPGLKAATDAARAVNGLLAVPELDGRKCDFWDVWHERGAEAVARALAEASKVSAPPDGPSNIERNTSSGFTLIQAKDLITLEEPDTEWVWEGILPAGGSSLVVAKPKVGKTCFATELALAMADGNDFLGRHTKKTPVVYLALEEKRSEIRKKLVARGNTPDGLYFHFGSAPDSAIQEVRAVIQKTKAGFLVVDVLQKLCRISDLNDYAEVTNVLEPLMSTAREENCHIMLTHHAGKADRPDGDDTLGSTALFGGVDTLIQIKKKDKRRSFFTIQRYGEDLPETIIDLKPDGSIVAVGSKQEMEIKEISSLILSALASAKLTEKEIWERVEKKHDIVAKELRALVHRKEVIRTGAGKSKDPYRYEKVSPHTSTGERGETSGNEASDKTTNVSPQSSWGERGETLETADKYLDHKGKVSPQNSGERLVADDDKADGWQPDDADKTPIFYASELPLLREKTPDQLRAIFDVKATFGGGMVRQ